MVQPRTAPRPKRPRTLSRIRTPRLPFPPRFFETQRAAQPQLVGPPSPDTAPDWWPGTAPEWWVYRWLKARTELVELVDWVYQQKELGGRVPGGAVVDFWFPFLELIWRVQGTYWHYQQGPEQLGRDLNSKLTLEAQGIVVVDLLDLDLEQPERRGEILEAALEGVELLEGSVWRNLT